MKKTFTKILTGLYISVFGLVAVSDANAGAKGGLDAREKAIVPISAFTASGDIEELKISLNDGLDAGLTESNLEDLISVIEIKVGKRQADNASDLLASVLGKERAETNAQKIIVTHTASEPPSKGPDDKFTGSVRIDTPFRAHDPAHFYGANVIFEAGSRTAWHTHKLGQLLIITSGVGRVQRWGNPAQEIRKGDVVWIPPHQKHWHGAAPDSPMTHIAIVEERSGKSTQWLEEVSDGQYGAKSE